jgi:hypothetical protein
MKKHIILSFFLVALAVASGHADDNHVTVYNQDLGLVKQVRTLDIKKSALPLRFSDVAAKLIPTSVHLRCLSGNKDFQVLEQNFEYDLVSSEKILEKYIDHPIEIVKENGDLVRGVLLNNQRGSLVLKTDDGIKMLPWNDKTSINVKELPEGLITRPTLIWELDGVRDRKEQIEVSYLTTGMNWHAEYVGVLNEKATQINLDAWVSVNNQCGATFKDAQLKLVAGEVHRAAEPRPVRRRAKSTDDMMLAAQAERGFQEREFFEYHVYELPRATTIRDNQIKQIALFPSADVKSEKKFFYNAMRDPKKIEVRVLFKNKENAGLGKPLPAGVFRIYQKDKESLEFVGEDRIDHTPRNEEVKITVGKAFDLLAERKVVKTRKVSERSERLTVEIELRNNKKKKNVTIIVEERLFYRHWEIEDSNFPFTKKDAFNIEFEVPVKSDSNATVRYTLLHWW